MRAHKNLSKAKRKSTPLGLRGQTRARRKKLWREIERWARLISGSHSYSPTQAAMAFDYVMDEHLHAG